MPEIPKTTSLPDFFIYCTSRQ